MRKRKIWIVFSSLVILGLLAAGCAKPPAVEEDTFICALSSDTGTLDPQKTGCLGECAVFTFPSLTIWNRLDWHTRPDLAESWENPDPLTWKFNLHQGVTFHNGQPLTAADVKYSFDRMMGKLDPDFPSGYRGTLTKLIDEIETPDDYTIIFHTNYPEVSFPTMICWGYIVPKAYIEEVGDLEFARHPIGAGPYKFKERVVSEYITYEAYEDYWNTNAKPGEFRPAQVRTVTFRIIPEAQTRMAALLTGEIDAIVNVSPDNAKELEKNPDINVYYTSRNQPHYIIMNWRAEKDPETGEPNPFRDVRVRQAMNYALDLDDIIANYGTGHEYRTTLLGKDALGYNPDRIIYKYNPEKARQLLAEAGYPNGFSTKFYIETVESTHEAMCKYWKDVGIDVKLTLTTSAVALRNLARKKLYGIGIGADGWGPDPATNWFESNGKYDGVYALHGKDEKVEKLIDEQAQEFDEGKRAELIDEVIQIMWKDAWFVPLWEPVLIKAIRADWNYDHERMPMMRQFSLPDVSRKK